jgi:hypothetical protein
MTIIPIPTAVPIPYEDVRAFCEKHHIIRLWLYGSVLREDFRQDSDIDVLVEFDPAHIPGWEIVSIEDELAGIVRRPVELTTPGGLREWVRPEVMKTAQVIYERDR